MYFAGAEIGTHRSLFSDNGVLNVALSYVGLRRRVKFSRPWRVRDKFESHVNVFLDSGAYTVNLDEKTDPSEVEDVYEHYKQFVLENLDDVHMVSEFDALPLGLEWIERERNEFWSTIPREKAMVVWHPEWGTGKLLEMAEQFELIGIPQTSIDGRDLVPILNGLSAKGNRLHGIGMTRQDAMEAVRWASVSSTSWVSPIKYGETIVWTGKELKRYPKRMKEEARKRHRTLFTSNGFDAAKIAADDGDELLRLSIWSYLQLEEHLNQHHKSPKPGIGVAPHSSDVPPDKVSGSADGVDTQPSEDAGAVSTPSRALTTRRETEMLPVMGISRNRDADDEEDEGIPVVTIRSDSMRMCNTCFLAEKCPGYEPDANCLYNIPITVRTREQFRALQHGLVEMQTQRVLFMQMVEQIEGGYADPNLTKELGVLQKMMAATAELEREGYSFRVEVSGSGDAGPAAGAISRLFGSDAGQRVQQIEGGPVRADDIIVEEIAEAEIVDG